MSRSEQLGGDPPIHSTLTRGTSRDGSSSLASGRPLVSGGNHVRVGNTTGHGKISWKRAVTQCSAEREETSRRDVSHGITRREARPKLPMNETSRSSSATDFACRGVIKGEATNRVTKREAKRYDATSEAKRHEAKNEAKRHEGREATNVATNRDATSKTKRRETKQAATNRETNQAVKNRGATSENKRREATNAATNQPATNRETNQAAKNREATSETKRREATNVATNGEAEGEAKFRETTRASTNGEAKGVAKRRETIRAATSGECEASNRKRKRETTIGVTDAHLSRGKQSFSSPVHRNVVAGDVEKATFAERAENRSGCSAKLSGHQVLLSASGRSVSNGSATAEVSVTAARRGRESFTRPAASAAGPANRNEESRGRPTTGYVAVEDSKRRRLSAASVDPGPSEATAHRLPKATNRASGIDNGRVVTADEFRTRIAAAVSKTRIRAPKTDDAFQRLLGVLSRSKRSAQRPQQVTIGPSVARNCVQATDVPEDEVAATAEDTTGGGGGKPLTRKQRLRPHRRKADLSALVYEQLPMPNDELLRIEGLREAQLPGGARHRSLANVIRQQQATKHEAATLIAGDPGERQCWRMKRYTVAEAKPANELAATCYNLWKVRKEGYTHVCNVPGSFHEILYYSRFFGIVPVDHRTRQYVALRNTAPMKKENLALVGVVGPRGPLLSVVKESLQKSREARREPKSDDVSAER